jgi:type IV secretion system protein VirD4
MTLASYSKTLDISRNFSMYLLARLLLFVAFSSAATCLLVPIVLFWPTSGLVAVAVVGVLVIRRRRGHLTTLGSARWASEDELRRQRMIGSDKGLILGRPVGPRLSLGERIRQLCDRRVGARDACRQLMQGERQRQREFVRLPQAIHTAVFAPSGGGKGVSGVLPFLLSEWEACCVIDFKGENARLTASHRRKRFRQRVVLLDPFHVVTQSPDTLNPLDFIQKEDPHAIDYCHDLANAIIIREPEEKEPHWTQSAQALTAAMIALVVYHGEPGETRSLQTVRDFLTNPQLLDKSIQVMCESTCWDGMLRRMGNQLRYFEGKERNSVLTTVGRNMKFLDTLAVATSTRSSSFNPAALRTGKLSVYCILPPDFMRSQSPLLRMWISTLMRAVVAGGLQERNKVHFILDEAASLGHMDIVDDAVDKFRGYGIRLQFYFQSLGQLKKCFPDGQDQTLLSNTSQVFYGVRDNATAEYVSNSLGEQTIIVESGGRSSGYSSQWNQGMHPSTGGGSNDNTSHNWQQQARKLLKPEEIIALDPRTAITLTPGVRPILTRLVRHYEEPLRVWRRRGLLHRASEAVATLAVSLLLAGGSTFLAFEGIEVVNQHLAQVRRASNESSSQPGRSVKHNRTIRARQR